MILSQTSEYALRALAHLAMQPAGAALNAREISAATGVPVHYLAKVLRQLAAAGLLETHKGRGGGFALGRPPAKIRFQDVFDATAEGPDPTHCAFGWKKCDAKSPCLLHPAWSEYKSALERWATDTTLAKVVEGARGRPARKRTAG